MSRRNAIAPVVRVHNWSWSSLSGHTYQVTYDNRRFAMGSDSVIGDPTHGDLAVLLLPGCTLPAHLVEQLPSTARPGGTGRLSRAVLMKTSSTGKVQRGPKEVPAIRVFHPIHPIFANGWTKDFVEGECVAAFLGIGGPAAPSMSDPAAADPPPPPLCPVVRVRSGANPNPDPLRDVQRGPHYLSDFQIVGRLDDGDLAILIPAGTRLPARAWPLVPHQVDGVVRRATLMAPEREGWRDDAPQAVRVAQLSIPPNDQDPMGRDAEFAEGECVAAFLGATRPEPVRDTEAPPKPPTGLAEHLQSLLQQRQEGATDALVLVNGQQAHVRFDGIEIYQSGRLLTPALTWRGQVVYRFDSHAIATGATLQLNRIEGSMPISLH